MKWSDSITLKQPLRDAQLLVNAPALDWETYLREREKAAYEQGRRDGEGAIDEQLKQQRQEMAELQNGVVRSLKEMLPQMGREMESVLIQLAFESAQKLVAGLPINAKMVQAVVREALSQAHDLTDISIRIHPDDLALLRKHKSPLLAGLPETGPLRFVASSEVTRGGCVIQTRFGLMDAQRETKLEQLRKAVNL